MARRKIAVATKGRIVAVATVREGAFPSSGDSMRGDLFALQSGKGRSLCHASRRGRSLCYAIRLTAGDTKKFQTLINALSPQNSEQLG